MLISTLEVYLNPPEGFSWAMQVAACYIEIDSQCLLLQQAPHKIDPGRWGVPAGKLETNEMPSQAAQRELFEETGILLQNPHQCQYISTLYMRKPSLDYVYYLFQIELNEMPSIRLSTEHQNYQWVHKEALKTFPLMVGAEEALCHFYENKKPIHTRL